MHPLAAAPAAREPYAGNDHSDWAWDERFEASLRRVDEGDLSGVDKPREDSCHTVWMELHEDLIASLGESRG